MSMTSVSTTASTHASESVGWDEVAADLPVDRPAGDGADGHVRVRLNPLPPGWTERRWTAALLALLHRYTGLEQLALVAPGDARAWRFAVHGADTGADLLASVERTLAAPPLPVAGDGRTPGAGVLVAAPGVPGERPADLALHVEGNSVTLVGDTRWWHETTIHRMAGHLATLAAGWGDDVSVRELPLLTERERAELAVDFNDTAVTWPDTGYLDLVREHALRTPDAPAVVHNGQVITFAELAGRASRIANRLRALGAEPGSRVGLLCPRSGEFVVAVLGILASGAAAVPLDPVNPDTRVRAMLADAEPLVVLVDPGLRDRLPDGSAYLMLDSDEFDDQSAEPPRVTVTADTVSHLIYTSGSTGGPKAVLERHGAIVNLVHWTRRAYQVRQGDRASWLSTPGFAVQLMEWMPYLALGATVHVGDADDRTPAQVRDWLVAEGITHTMLVAALAERVWGLHWPEDTRLRIMVTTAERVHSWPPEDAPFRVVMTYGSTETTNTLTCLDLGAGIDHTMQATPGWVRASRQVPVGRPIANARVYLLDDLDRPVPPGVVGRLHVAGAGLAAGYHRRPELTEKKFRANPLQEEPSAILYDTGDLARMRADGAVELLGRGDSQLKVRGFRVEIGEVETTVSAAPGVGEAVVVAREAAPGDMRLLAFVTPVGGEPVRPGAVRAYVAGQLPHYMVPTVVVLDRLPRLPNGKVDARALPAEPPSADATEAVAPRDDTERRLLRVWTTLFGGDRIGVHDNFFEIGGHSLLAFRLIDSIRGEFATELSLSDLYDRPTVAELAELLRQGRGDVGAGFGGMPPIVPDPEHRFEPFPLTDSQQALWIGRGDAVELGNVGCHGYFEWESETLDPQRLATAWRKLVQRHDALRTVIRPDGTQQVLAEPPDYDIAVLDLRDLPEAEARARVELLRERLSHQVMDDGQWPLFDVRLTLLPGPAPTGQRVRLHLSLDFLISDAWSYFQVLVPDLVALYEHPDQELPPLELTFRDYVLALREHLPESDVYRRSELYWSSRLADLPPAPALPARPEDQERLPVRFDRVAHRVAPGDWERLKAAALDLGVTPSGLLAAVFAEVLRGWSGQEAFTLNFPLFNRLPLHQQIDRIIGDTTTTLLLAIPGSGGTFAERAQALQRQLWADLEHRYYSGVQVLRALTRLRGSVVPAMPVVMTSLLGQPPRHYAAGIGRSVYSISQTPQVSIDFQVFEIAGELQFNWDFLPGLFPDGMVQEMFAAYRDVLDRLLRDPAAWRVTSFEVGPCAPAASGRGEGDGSLAADTAPAWERYWSGITRTGRDGDVLWDADSAEEIAWCRAQVRDHFDPDLPLLDIGCGNGRYTRRLVGRLPFAIGMDVSASAIERAVAESVNQPGVSFRVLDATDPDAAEEIAEEVGPANVFVRGVLHVLDDRARARTARSLATLVGRRGTLLVMEPAYREGGFGYLGHVGGARGRAADLVRPLEHAGVGASRRFAGDELARFFPPEQGWEHIASGTVPMAAVAPDADTDPVSLPGFYALLRRTG